MITMCCEMSYLYIGVITQLSYLNYVGFLNMCSIDPLASQKILIVVNIASIQNKLTVKHRMSAKAY